MYENFTDRAREVMKLAEQEAWRFNHEYIGTEHILLGLVKEGAGTAAKLLENSGIRLGKIRQEVEWIVQAGPDTVTMRKLPLTPKSQKAVELALNEAARLHQDCGTEHILLGLLRQHETVAAHVLTYLGIHLQEACEQIRLVATKLASGGQISETDSLFKTPRQAEVYPDHPAVNYLVDRTARLQAEKEQAITDCDFDRAARLRDEQEEVRQQLRLLLKQFRRATDA